MKRSNPIFQGLEASVAAFAGLYARARSRRAAFAPYATAPLLSALQKSSAAGGPDGLLAAIVAEQHDAPHALWTSLLVAAFEPMLRGLVRAAADDEDAMPRAMLAFLEAVRLAAARSDTSFFLREVRLRTQELYFGQEPGDDVGEIVEAWDDDEPAAGAILPHGDDPATEASAGEVARLLQAGAGGDRELCDVLVATVACDETLSEYVDWRYGRLSAKRRSATYTRLQSARERALERVRARVAAAA